MKYLEDGWAIPDYERKIPSVLERIKHQENDQSKTLINYQERVRTRATLQVSETDIFIDVGANIGIWSAPLSLIFNKVLAFEVNPYLNDCFESNIKNFGCSEKVIHHDFGLANRSKQVSLPDRLDSCWGTFITDDINAAFKVKSFDEIVSELVLPNEKVSMIKLDAEGSEPYILCGMIETLLKYKPIVIIEDKFFPERYPWVHSKTGTQILNAFGMKQLERHKHDFIFGW